MLRLLDELFRGVFLGLDSLSWVESSLEALRKSCTSPFHLWGETLRFQSPQWAFLFLIVLILPVVSRYSLSDLGRKRRAALLLLQVLFIGSICFALMGPLLKFGVEPKSRVILFDVSDSISEQGLLKAKQYLLEHQKSGEVQRVILFGADARLVDPERLSVEPWRTLVDTRSSDLSGALNLAHAHCPQGTDCHLYLHSDGIENRGSAIAEVSRLHTLGSTVHVQGYQVPSTHDLAMSRLSAPQNIRAGESFYLEVELVSQGVAEGRLEVTRKLPQAQKIFSEEQRITNKKQVIRIQTSALGSGEHEYFAEFKPKALERFRENNRATLSVRVPQAPKVLVLDPESQAVAPLVSLLRAQRFVVDSRRPLQFPETFAELERFDFVILSDVPRADLSRQGEARLIDYVRAGGALLVAGGEAAYAGGGWQGAPLFQVLPVGIKSLSRRDLPGVALSLVIDRSGSMSGYPLSMAKEACKDTLNLLKPSDLIEVVAFDSKPLRAVRLTPARGKVRSAASIMRIRTGGGGTNLFRPLNLAFEDLAAVRAEKKHIILLTDGNAGTEGLLDLAQMAFSEGITITTLGLGDEVNLPLLEAIADAGGGRFHHVIDAHHLPKIFSRETARLKRVEIFKDWLGVQLHARPRFLKGLNLRDLPLLRGMNSTQLTGQFAEMIFGSDEGEPVFSRRPIGQGWTLAWSSDLKMNQGRQWLTWNTMGALLGQMIRGHVQEKQELLFPLKLQKLGDTLLVRFERVNEQGGYQSQLQSRLRFTHMESKEVKTVDFRLIAPGLYEARVSLESLGSYQLEATHLLNEAGVEREVGRSFLAFSHSVPDELLKLTPDPELLSKIAQVGGGMNPPRSLAQKSPGGNVRGKERSIVSQAIWCSIVLLLLGLMVRRLSFHSSGQRARELS